MKLIRGSRGDTEIDVIFYGLDGPELGDAAPAEFRLRVSVFFTSDNVVLNNHGAFHAIGFDSTVGHFSDPSRAHSAISSILKHEDPRFAANFRPWLSFLSGVASSQARSLATGFHLFAHISIYCRTELRDAAFAMNGSVELGDDGVLRLIGGECIETVELSTGDESEENECPICFEGLVEEAVRMKDCSHVFHGHCLYCWLESNQSCPLCRRSAVAPGRAAIRTDA